MIIAISGTPGTGKTVVADALSKALGWRVLHLNDVAKAHGLWLGRDKKRDCMIVDVHAVETEVRSIAEKERNLIIESHYAHEMDADVTVILRCSPEELRRRMEKKGWRSSKIDENIQAEIMEICRQEAWELGRHIIDVDTTGRTATAVAAEIVKNPRIFKGK